MGFSPTLTEAGGVATEGGAGGNRSCEDNNDNDLNGLVDAYDPQCQQCGNGMDDDLDGFFDEAPFPDIPGGQAEGGGNDMAVFNSGIVLLNPTARGPDPGTFLHELGHNLGLGHGGSDGHNCKPNHVSIMNYQHQIGILQARNNFAGGPLQGQDANRDGIIDFRMVDFWPPRHLGGRSDYTPTGPQIVEIALNENAVRVWISS